MPTYDYVCSACGHRMEVVHGIHGHGPETCPVCGGPMRKAFVAPAVHYKGSGWAKKDRGAVRSTKAAVKTGGAEDASSTDSQKPADGVAAGAVEGPGGPAGSPASSSTGTDD